MLSLDDLEIALYLQVQTQDGSVQSNEAHSTETSSTPAQMIRQCHTCHSTLLAVVILHRTSMLFLSYLLSCCTAGTCNVAVVPLTSGLRGAIYALP